MAGVEARTSGRIFISYRREETAYPAGWLSDRLTERFGRGSVFKDVDSIAFGDDFAAAIATAVSSCDVLLALIGPRWVTMTDQHGRRRLDRAGDFVRREIETAHQERARDPDPRRRGADAAGRRAAADPRPARPPPGPGHQPEPFPVRHRCADHRPGEDPPRTAFISRGT